MPEVLEEPQVQTPPTEAAPSLRDAFAARTTVEEAPTPVESAAPSQAAAPAPEAEKAAPETKPADYGDFVKELGYETPEALKERLAATKDYDPKTVETLKANQRDAYDLAIREMLTTTPEKAEQYFALQRLQPDVLATGTPEEQRQLLFEDFKLKNPQFTGKLAEFEFQDEWERKYALAQDGEADDPATERAKLHLEAALKLAAPAVKSAQEAAKIAIVPKPAEAKQPTQQERDAAVSAWLKNVDATLAAPIEQTVQVDGKPVHVVFDSKDAGLKDALDNPEDFFLKLIYPNGLDKPADFAGIARAYASIKQPGAIALAAAEAARANIGAHKSLSDLTNPAADAPQPVVGSAAGGYKSAFANAKSAE